MSLCVKCEDLMLAFISILPSNLIHRVRCDTLSPPMLTVCEELCDTRTCDPWSQLGGQRRRCLCSRPALRVGGRAGPPRALRLGTAGRGASACGTRDAERMARVNAHTGTDEGQQKSRCRGARPFCAVRGCSTCFQRTDSAIAIATPGPARRHVACSRHDDAMERTSATA